MATKPEPGRRAEEAVAATRAPLTAWAERSRHDLMTPLAVIDGMAQTLESSWDRLTVAERSSLLASIRSQAARATAMLEEGFAIARAAAPDQRA